MRTTYFLKMVIFDISICSSDCRTESSFGVFLLALSGWCVSFGLPASFHIKCAFLLSFTRLLMEGLQISRPLEDLCAFLSGLRRLSLVVKIITSFNSWITWSRSSLLLMRREVILSSSSLLYFSLSILSQFVFAPWYLSIDRIPVLLLFTFTLCMLIDPKTVHDQTHFG